MAQFANEAAERAYRDGEAPGVPSHVARRAGWLIHVLLSAHGLQDVAIMGRMAMWSNAPGVIGFRVEGKWHIVFTWQDGAGAMEVALERR